MLAGRVADPRRPHRAGAGPRPAARRAETRYPGPQSAGRQRADQLADPDPPGPGRQHRVAVRQDVVVLQRAGRQRPDRAAADRQPQHRAWRPSPRTATSSPASIDKLETADHRAVRRPRPDRQRDHRAGQRHRVADRPARPGPAAAGRHRRPAGPAGAAARPGQGTAWTSRSRRRPANYRKLVRLGSYGSWINQYTLRAVASGSPTCRAAPRTSRGSCNTPEGARSPDA